MVEGDEAKQVIIRQNTASVVDTDRLESLLRKCDFHDLNNALVPARMHLDLLAACVDGDEGLILREARSKISEASEISIGRKEFPVVQIEECVGLLAKVNPDALGPTSRSDYQVALYASKVAARLAKFMGCPPDRIPLAEMNVLAMVDNVLSALAIYGADICYRIARQGDVFAEVNALHLERIVWNLCKNAQESIMLMGKQGSITISAFYQIDDVPRYGPVEYAAISVTDSGCGMTTGQMRRACDPRYTTSKDLKLEHGYGLTYVRYLVNDVYKGWMEFLSRQNVGTRVSVVIPRRFQGDRSRQYVE